jgi:3-oxoacyl-[acyl-carrier protein] reductase
LSSSIFKSLTDKVCIITGAGSGIGRFCARLLAAEQCKVVLVDINSENLKTTLDELSAIADPANFLSLALNICSEADMADMASKTLAHFGRIDALIASAGILRPGGIMKTAVEMSLADWQIVLDVNLTGTFLSNRAVLPTMMMQKQGDIINISSVSGREGKAFDTAYCASKFGIIGLTESISEEVSSYGIRVQTLLPDAVDTPLWDQNGAQAIKAQHALPPERVAEFILYLLALPRDAMLLNPIIAPLKTRKKRR